VRLSHGYSDLARPRRLTTFFKIEFVKIKAFDELSSGFGFEASDAGVAGLVVTLPVSVNSVLQQILCEVK